MKNLVCGLEHILSDLTTQAQYDVVVNYHYLYSYVLIIRGSRLQVVPAHDEPVCPGGQ